MNGKDDDDDLTELIGNNASNDEQSTKSSTVELEEISGVLPSTYSSPNDEVDSSKIPDLLRPNCIGNNKPDQVKAFTVINGKSPTIAANGNSNGTFSVNKTPYNSELEDKLNAEAAERSERARRHWAIVRTYVFSDQFAATVKQQRKKNAHGGFFGKHFFGDSKGGFLGGDDDDAEMGDVAMTREEQEEDLMQSSSSTGDAYIRSSIPYLPQGAAAVCLVLNIVLPGSGTMLSGLLVLCCGKSRLPSREDGTGTALCVNIMVGTMQLFTVTLLLVGWIWSIVWGIYLVILAQEYRKDQKIKRERVIEKKVINVMNKGLHQWNLRT